MSNPPNIVMGNRDDSSRIHEVDKLIDVRVYNRVLSPDEMRDLWLGGPELDATPVRYARWTRGDWVAFVAMVGFIIAAVIIGT